MLDELFPYPNEVSLNQSQIDFATIQTKQHYHLKRVQTLAPALCHVTQGHKVVHWHGQSLHVTPHDLLVFPAGVVLDIENHPDDHPDNPLYQAQIISFPLKLIQDYQLKRQSSAQQLTPSTPNQLDWSVPLNPELDFSWTTLIHATQQHLSNHLQQHLAQGLLLALEGKPQLELLLTINQQQLKYRLQQLFLKKCNYDWQLSDAAQRLHLGESTIRRKLAEEGSSFRQVLDEVRFTIALGMVQTTDLPISSIAERCGYESPSRFSIKFRHMYGASPSELRIK